jgi:MFS family permease
MSAPPAPARFASNVPKLYVIHYCFWLHTISAVLIPFFRDWGGVPLERILLLNAWFMTWNFLLEVPTGTVADRFGRKVSLGLGCAAGAVAPLIYTVAPRIEMFLLGEVVFALAFTLNSGAHEALLYDSLDDRAAAPRAFARLESWKLAGIVTGALVGSLLATSLGLRATVAAQAIPVTLGALVVATLREPPRQGPLGAPRPSYLETLRDGVRHFADDAALRPLAFDAVAIGALSFLVIWLYQPLLEAAGVGLAAFGSVHVALTLGQIVVLGNLGRLGALFGTRRGLLRGFAVIAGTSFLGLGLVREPAAAVVVLIVLAVSFGQARMPVLTSAMNLHIPSAHRATVLSVVSGLRKLAVVLANGAASFGVRYSVHATLLALGAGILAATALSRVREEHLGGDEP